MPGGAGEPFNVHDRARNAIAVAADLAQRAAARRGLERFRSEQPVGTEPA